MKSAIFAAVALAVSAVYAQMIPGLPACATPCLANSSSISGCPEGDYKCTCSSKPFIMYAAACFQKSCTADQLSSAAAAAHAFCQSQGVNLSTIENEGPTTDTTVPTKTPMMPPTITATRTPLMPPTKTPMMPPTKTPMMPPPETPTEVTTSYPPTANVSTPYPTTTETTTLYSGTTTTINGTVTSVTVSRNITNPTVVPPGNTQSDAVKNIAGLGAIVMAIAGFFAL